MPLNLDIFALMMLYEITLPAGVAQRISRREKQARRVSLLIAQVARIATCPMCMVTFGSPSCFLKHDVLKQIDSKQDLAANCKFLKSFHKSCASSLLFYCLAKGHAFSLRTLQQKGGTKLGFRDVEKLCQVHSASFCLVLFRWDDSE